MYNHIIVIIQLLLRGVSTQSKLLKAMSGTIYGSIIGVIAGRGGGDFRSLERT